MNPKVIEILTKAKALIDTPEKWCQGNYHEDADGKPMDRRPDLACRHCTIGAISLASTSYKDYAADYFVESEANRFLAIAIVSTSIAMWNDAPERTHAEVMQAFDRAIMEAGK